MYGDVDHPDIAKSLAILGVVLDHQRKLAAAREHFEQALAMERRMYGDTDHPLIAKSLVSVGNVLFQLGELPAAGHITSRHWQCSDGCMGTPTIPTSP